MATKDKKVTTIEQVDACDRCGKDGVPLFKTLWVREINDATDILSNGERGLYCIECRNRIERSFTIQTRKSTTAKGGA